MLKKILTYLLLFVISGIGAMQEIQQLLMQTNFSSVEVMLEKEDKDSLLLDAILTNNKKNIRYQLLKYTNKDPHDLRILRFLTNFTFRTNRNHTATSLFERIEQITYTSTISIIERNNLAADVLSPTNSYFSQDIIALNEILTSNDFEDLQSVYQENFDIDCRIIKIVMRLKEKLHDVAINKTL